MANLLRDVIARNRAGEADAIVSVCSAHEDVIEASLLRAKELSRPIVIEATSNQVNQFGGYTGLEPEQFRDRVYEIRDSVGLAPEQMVLGGDHLGPQAWHSEPQSQAMAKATDMMKAYARAGFTKIHLDCSQRCADDPERLGDDVCANRAAQLAYDCLISAPDPDALLFVVGTEVPPPGGAKANEAGGPSITKAVDASATLTAHQEAFENAGIGGAWCQVGGLVVQPGVEFGPMDVDPLPADVDEAHFAQVLADWPGICLEAHSTDYQDPHVFPRLARMGFAFQKVGPILTFAWRAGLYSIEDLCQNAGGVSRKQHIADVMEELMCSNPEAWQGHYQGPEEVLKNLRHNGFADRIRYYWNDPKAVEAVSRLLEDFDSTDWPDTFLEEKFGVAYAERICKLVEEARYKLSKAVLVASVQDALDPYFS